MGVTQFFCRMYGQDCLCISSALCSTNFGIHPHLSEVFCPLRRIWLMKGSLCKENCIICRCIFVGQELPSDSSWIKMFSEGRHSFFDLWWFLIHLFWCGIQNVIWHLGSRYLIPEECVVPLMVLAIGSPSLTTSLHWGCIFISLGTL